jgi:hypothetical protein
MLERITREILRREQVPLPVLWILASDGMAAWYRWLARGLRDHLRENTRAIVSRCIAQAFTRRYAALRAIAPALPDPEQDPRAVPLTIRGLYRAPSAGSILWVLDAIGGPPRGLQENLRSFRLVRALDYRTRWIEVATHLGEVLIALTDHLPQEGLPNASSILGQICFEAGVRYGERARDRWRLSKSPASAIEVLRVGEYVFRVNPEHTSTADEAAYTGMIEGSACPWFMRPGWHRMHCGIFGQFQAGVSSVFDLKYKLTKTIPRHGGDSCRVDLVRIGTGGLHRKPIGARERSDPQHP